MGFLIMRLIGFGASCEVVLLWGFDAHCGLIIPYKQFETKNMKHHNVIIIGRRLVCRILHRELHGIRSLDFVLNSEVTNNQSYV